MQGDFCLDIGRSEDALAMKSIFQTGEFFLTLVAGTLEVAGAWVVR